MVGVCSAILINGFAVNILRAISIFGDGFVPILLVVVLVVYLFYKKKYLEAGIFALAPLLGNIIKYLLKNYFQVPRPAEFGCVSLGSYGDIYSFPSGHTVFATIFFGFVAYLFIKNKKGLLAFALVILIVAMGASRYLLGAHWILDILGGYFVGGGILAISIILYSYVKAREKNMPKEHAQGQDRRNEYRLYDDKGYILKAGSVIVKNDKVLVLYRASHKDFTLPKGHIEKDEAVEVALKREILEETGLEVSIVKSLPDFFYEYHQGDGKICVKMFLTKPIKGKLTPEHKGDKLIWVSLNKLSENLSFDGLKEYVLKNMNEFKDV